MTCPSCGAHHDLRPGAGTVPCAYCGGPLEAPALPGRRSGGLLGMLADDDGVPGFLRGLGQLAAGSGAGLAGSATWEVDGVRYDSLDEMPPHVRRLVESLGAGARALHADSGGGGAVHGVRRTTQVTRTFSSATPPASGQAGCAAVVLLVVGLAGTLALGAVLLA